MPLYVIGGTILLNFVMDPILIFGWGVIPAMGVRGAALEGSMGLRFNEKILSQIFDLLKGPLYLVFLQVLRWQFVL